MVVWEKWWLTYGTYFFQIVRRNRTLLCTSSIQLLQFLKSKTKCR